jgi:hypothetical protein
MVMPVRTRMTFNDSKLQEHFDKAVAFASRWPEEQRPVLALLDAYYRFAFEDGHDAPRPSEALQHLLSPGLRPALCAWYQQCRSDDMNPNALAFRERLSKYE